MLTLPYPRMLFRRPYNRGRPTRAFIPGLAPPGSRSTFPSFNPFTAGDELALDPVTKRRQRRRHCSRRPSMLVSIRRLVRCSPMPHPMPRLLSADRASCRPPARSADQAPAHRHPSCRPLPLSPCRRLRDTTARQLRRLRRPECTSTSDRQYQRPHLSGRRSDAGCERLRLCGEC